MATKKRPAARAWLPGCGALAADAPRGLALAERNGLGRALGLDGAGGHDGTVLAGAQAGAALGAGLLVDDVDEARTAQDGVLLAGVHAGVACLALAGQDVVGEKRLALPRRAGLLADVGRDLCLEEVEEGHDGPGHNAALLAEALALHDGAEVAQKRQVGGLALLAADVRHDGGDLVAALVAEDAAATGLVAVELADLVQRVGHAVLGRVDAHVVAGELDRGLDVGG